MTTAHALLTSTVLLFAVSACDDAAGASALGAASPQPSTAVDDHAAGAAAAEHATAHTQALADAPLESWRRELLELAWQAASAFPLHPHLKNRSRAQDQVVAACLELDQVERALDYAREIENWRRGSGLADVALYLARTGAGDLARPLIDEASRLADDAADPVQGWRRDTIRSKLAGACLLLGDQQRSADLQRDLEPSEVWRVGLVQMELVSERGLDGQLALLEQSVEVGDLDAIEAAVRSLTVLYGRVHGQPELQAATEAALDRGLGRLPVQKQLGLLVVLVDTALAHDDHDQARSHTERADVLIAGNTWLPEQHVPFVALQASLHARLGDSERAGALLDAGVRLYERERQAAIVDVFRAETLRPLALAYHELGDHAAALQVLATVIEDGAHNPNARPRAEDLSETCLALAVSGLRPDQALRARLDSIRAGLVAPW